MTIKSPTPASLGVALALVVLSGCSRMEPVPEDFFQKPEDIKLGPGLFSRAKGGFGYGLDPAGSEADGSAASREEQWRNIQRARAAAARNAALAAEGEALEARSRRLEEQSREIDRKLEELERQQESLERLKEEVQEVIGGSRGNKP